MDYFVDLHCHMLPGLDDGPSGIADALAMAELAASDGIRTVVVTPHQLGNYRKNTAGIIREQTALFQKLLIQRGIELQVLPGGDVRIEPELVTKIRADQVTTLADRGRHVLLELPHEVYLPLEGLLRELRFAGLVGILSHPERNRGILNKPNVLRPLLDHGCLFQITAGSLLGDFGSQIQKFSEWMIKQKLVHFVSTDAHSPRSRLPLLSQAFNQVVKLAGQNSAIDLFCRNPASVVAKSQKAKCA